MEGEGVLDVLVPVGPIVVAIEFLVFMGEVKGLEVGVEFAILLEEEVICAAVKAEGGAEVWGAVFGEGEGVVGAVLPVGAEDGLEFGELGGEIFGAGLGFVEGSEEGTGVGGGAAEEVGEFEGEFDGAVAAHGEAADDAAFPARNGGKNSVDEGEDVFDDVVFVGEAGGRRGVGVPAAGGAGHDDDHGEGGGVAFDGGAAGPDGVVVAEAVEEVEDGEGAGAGVGEDGGEGGGGFEGGGEVGELSEGHSQFRRVVKTTENTEGTEDDDGVIFF